MSLRVTITTTAVAVLPTCNEPPPHSTLPAANVAPLLHPFLRFAQFRFLSLSSNERLGGSLAALGGEDGRGEPVLPCLKNLYLHNCPMLEGGLDLLADKAQLVTLNVDNCTGLHGDQKALKLAMPKLKILSMHGVAP